MLNSTYFTYALVSIFALSVPVIAQNKRPKKKTQSARAKALTPAEQLKTFTLPDGFVIELVASEENGLVNPIDLAFDDAGRLWTQTAQMYPLDPQSKFVGRKSLDALDKGELGNKSEFDRIKSLYQLKTRGKDKILLIEKPTEAVQGQLSVFAEGMTIPQSILPYKNGLYVAHGSEMLYLEDKDNDGKSDGHRTVLSGFGYTDSHTMSHTLVRGPGGWVHFSHGALNKGKVRVPKSNESASVNYSKIARFSLDETKLEVINNGLNNIWGFDMKANGQWFGTEANDLFYSLVPMDPMMGYPGIGNDKLHPAQPFLPTFHQFKVGGTGISGLAYDENGSKGFPAEWKDAGFLANPITSKINAVIADRNADGSVVSKHLPDFLTCSDDWFRPVNIEFGPDGCLYIVDWYNKIVSHNEVSRSHPDRDKTHGRIWRVRHESQKVGNIPNVMKASDADLLKHLRAEILWEKRAAWHQIVDRNATSLATELNKIAGNTSEAQSTRILALWSLEGLGQFDLSLMKKLVTDKDPNIRREAVRSLNTFKPSIEDVVALTSPLINDQHYMVKEQVLRTLGKVGVANNTTIEMLISAAKPKVKGNKLDIATSYKSNFQRFLAITALEKYPTELHEFLNSSEAKDLPQENLNQASQALPVKLRIGAILLALKNGESKLDEGVLVALSDGMNDPEVLDQLKDHIVTKEFIELAIASQHKLRSDLLHQALVSGTNKLLTSSSVDDQNLGLRAVVNFQNPLVNDSVMKLVRSKKPAEVNSLDIAAVAASEKVNHAVLVNFAKSDELGLSERMEALFAAGKTKKFAKNASGIFAQLYKGADKSQKTQLFNLAMESEQGIGFLFDLVGSKKIVFDGVDITAKKKMVDVQPKHPVRKALVKKVNQGLVKKKQQAHKKIATVAKAIEAGSITGNSQTGKGVAQSCIQCHQIGSDGHDLAPALGGFKNRDAEHLLTAIIAPNEAIEGGYRLYRLVKKNGQIIEGYMYRSDEYGTTIAKEGGQKIFTAKEQIKSEKFLNGQSFMPSRFDQFPDQLLADLVAYLRTL